MPWCEDCARYWAPSAMRADGTCPTCGRSLEAPRQTVTAQNLDLKRLAAGKENAEGDGDADARAPWHFKLLVVALVIYLTWRFIQIFA